MSAFPHSSLPTLEPSPEVPTGVEGSGGPLAARWTPEGLAVLVDHLARGAEALEALSTSDLLAAWGDTVEALRDPASPERRQIEGPLRESTGLSAAGLAAGLEAVLGGVARPHAEALAASNPGTPWGGHEPVWVVLASNLPGLAVQPLLPALLRRRPVLLKSATAEPVFAPALVDALCQREPRLRAALAATTWHGGEHQLEDVLQRRISRVVAYGGGETLADLERRFGPKLVGHGPKLSLAVVGAGGDPAGVDPEAIAEGLAIDTALFDQRGCLSLQVVYTAGDATALADALALALAEVARRWPMGERSPGTRAAVRQLRDEALMRGLHLPALAPDAGTVVVEPNVEPIPSPGARTLRIHPLADLDRLPGLLAPWRGHLQGVALAGDDAWALAPALRELGATRCAAPGELQTPDASWHNGGIAPLEVFDEAVETDSSWSRQRARIRRVDIAELSRRLDDKNPESWMTLDELKRWLKEKP